MTENKNPTYMNAEPEKSDLDQVTQYVNSNAERQDEEASDQNTLYEHVQGKQGNEPDIAAYDPSGGNQQRQATEYEEIKQDQTNVYDDLQDHQQEHPYADLSSK